MFRFMGTKSRDKVNDDQGPLRPKAPPQNDTTSFDEACTGLLKTVEAVQNMKHTMPTTSLAHATNQIKEARDALQNVLASSDSSHAHAPSLLSPEFLKQIMVENLPTTPSALPPTLPKVMRAEVPDQPQGPLRAKPATDEQPQRQPEPPRHGGSLRTITVTKGEQCNNCPRSLASGPNETAKKIWILPQCECVICGNCNLFNEACTKHSFSSTKLPIQICLSLLPRCPSHTPRSATTSSKPLNALIVKVFVHCGHAFCGECFPREEQCPRCENIRIGVETDRHHGGQNGMLE